MPKMVKSEAKKRLLVTEGELRDALLHGHEVVRGLVAVDLGHRVLDGRHQASAGPPRSRTASALRVWIHSSSRAVLPEVLPERDVDGGRRLGRRSSG